MKIRYSFIVFLLGVITSFAQFSEFNYKREIKAQTNTWHTMILPLDVFAKVENDFRDIRIYGVTVAQDTIEVPYLLRIDAPKVDQHEVPFKIINTSFDDDVHYFTLEIDALAIVNTITLNFKESNFDWRVNLQASQNLQNWVTITNDYRIVSINTPQEKYTFSKLNFPDSRFKYYKIAINTKSDVNLISANIFQQEVVKPVYSNYTSKSIITEVDKKNKQSIIEIELEDEAPISVLDVFVNFKNDYYRPFRLQYISDSIYTKSGIKPVYTTVLNGVLSSIEPNTFNLKHESLKAKKIRLIVDNYDNKPLDFDSIQLKGFQHKLIARFDDNAKYYLVYGNQLANMPYYDIQKFADKVPVGSTIELGDEESIFNAKKVTPLKSEPIFKNKLWLWLVLLVIVGLLGWASYTMIKKQ